MTKKTFQTASNDRDSCCYFQYPSTIPKTQHNRLHPIPHNPGRRLSAIPARPGVITNERNAAPQVSDNNYSLLFNVWSCIATPSPMSDVRSNTCIMMMAITSLSHNRHSSAERKKSANFRQHLIIFWCRIKVSEEEELPWARNIYWKQPHLWLAEYPFLLNYMTVCYGYEKERVWTVHYYIIQR